MFLVLIGSLSFWPSPRGRDHTEKSRDFAKAIAFVLDAQCTDQESGCQVTHELEMQGMMVLHIA